MAGSMIRGEAEVLESSRPEPRTHEDDAGGEFDVSDFGVGRHSFRLEVRLPGHDPYEVDARFKVPAEVQFGRKRSMLLRPLVKRHRVPVGITLPVDVDLASPDNVMIDWDAFLVGGGHEEMKRLNTAAGVEKTRQLYPEQHTQMSASAKPAAESWAASVRAGAMSREQFEESIARYVQLGFLSAEDAEAIRKSLDGP